MTAEHTPIPTTQQLNDIEQAKAWFQRHGSHALTAILAVLIAITGFNMLRSRLERRTVEADRRLASAQSVTDFEALIRDFEKTGTAPLAVLSLGKLHFDNGNYEAALTQYERFLTQWPTHDMTTAATLGRIFCIEARGQQGALEEAAAAFAAFAAGNPGHYLYPQAVFGQARCLEQLNRLEEARTLYEDFIAANPDNLWSTRAEELLTAIQRRLRRAAPQA